MNIKLHENGWTVLVDDFDFTTATQSDADQIARLVSSNIAVVVTGPNVEKLTPEDQVKFCSMIGHLEEYEQDTAWGRAIALSGDEVGKKMQRVTGEVNGEGHPGLFGHDEELDWHNNTPWDPKRKPMVWLKSIRNSEGCRTSWSNTILAFNDLKKEDPDFIAQLEEKNYRIVCGYKQEGGHTSMYNYWSEFGELQSEVHSNASAMPLVFTNETGHTGFFLPYLQTFNLYGLSLEESTAILDKIWKYCQQEKYIYHHDWAPGGGELVIAEQWNSVHKRFEFDGMKKRMMHRIALDYTNTSWWPNIKDKFNKQIMSALKQNIRERRELEKFNAGLV